MTKRSRRNKKREKGGKKSNEIYLRHKSKLNKNSEREKQKNEKDKKMKEGGGMKKREKE